MNKYLIIFLFIIVLVVIHFLDNNYCSEGKIFYLNKIENRIVKIDINDYKNKGIEIVFYFDSTEKIFYFKNTDYFNKNTPIMEIGDSIYKKANTEDFNLYRNGVLIFDGKNLDCNCKYCE